MIAVSPDHQPDPTVHPLDHLALRGKREAPALVLKDQVLSHETLNRRVGQLAAWLAAQPGAAPGARVATWLGKGLVACLMPLAAVRAGLVHVPINPVLRRAQAAHILADSGAASFTATNAAITLANAGNAFNGTVTLTNTGTADISVANNRSLILGAVNAAGNLTVTAAGNVSQAANTVVVAAGVSAFTATNGGIALPAANSFGTSLQLSNSGTGNVTVNSNVALALGNVSVTGPLTVTAAGAITQAVNTTVSAAGGRSAC